MLKIQADRTTKFSQRGIGGASILRSKASSLRSRYGGVGTAKDESPTLLGAYAETSKFKPLIAPKVSLHIAALFVTILPDVPSTLTAGKRRTSAYCLQGQASRVS